MKKVSVCYVLSYYSPDYVRTRTLVKALQGLDHVILYQARNTSNGMARYFQSLWKLIVIRIKYDPECYILGFRGYELYWIVRSLTIGRRLIFDHMMSPYDSLVNESVTVKPYGLIAKFIYLYERSILSNADMLLTDTESHKQYFQELFHIAPSKIITIPVGTDESLFHPTDTSPDSLEAIPFEVLYYGSFLPLHGIPVILDAASQVRDMPIHFTLIGGNRLDLSGFARSLENLHLQNITHITWVEFGELPDYIARSDLGLGGPFGNTGQAHRVITSKTFQFLSMAKPVIVGVTNEDFGFEDKRNCLTVRQGDAGALANAILWAFNHRTELKRIGRSGHDLYQARHSIRQISERISECFPV